MPDGDDLTPPANALAAANLLRFGALSGDPAYTYRAARILGAFGAPLTASRQDAAPFGIALSLQKRPFRIFAVAGDRRRKEMDALLHTLRLPFDPTRIIVFADAPAPKQPLATWLPSLALIKPADEPRVYECTKEKCELVSAGAVK
jgi:uncharacterized protein YyaL (SSP411 family)